MSNRFKTLSAALKGEAPIEKPIHDQHEAVDKIVHQIKKKGRSPGKRSNPDYEQVGLYVPKKLHMEVKKRLIDDEKDFSELVSNLLEQWVTNA